MKLAKKYREEFQAWAKDYLLSERESSTEELYAALLEDNPLLAKQIAQAAAKTGAKAYIGRYLLRRFVNQGWLRYTNKSGSCSLSKTIAPIVWRSFIRRFI